MNEKIKQLAQQAGIKIAPMVVDGEEYNYLEVTMDGYDDLEDFAESIIKECVNVFEAEVDTWKEMDPYQGSIKRQGTKAIKQHFGVGESVSTPMKCSVCGTTENVRWVGGSIPFLCDDIDCVPY